MFNGHMFISTDIHLGHRSWLYDSITVQGLSEQTPSCRQLWGADTLILALHLDWRVNS